MGLMGCSRAMKSQSKDEEGVSHTGGVVDQCIHQGRHRNKEAFFMWNAHDLPSSHNKAWLTNARIGGRLCSPQTRNKLNAVGCCQ